MTNLHLGGGGATWPRCGTAAGAPAWRRALDTCVAAAACFPGSLHVGVDLMFALGLAAGTRWPRSTRSVTCCPACWSTAGTPTPRSSPRWRPAGGRLAPHRAPGRRPVVSAPAVRSPTAGRARHPVRHAGHAALRRGGDELAAAGRTPTPGPRAARRRWERRHTPASFTYAAHHAFFAGFLPTPVAPGPHPRLFAAAFPGSETAAADTWVFDAPDLVARPGRGGLPHRVRRRGRLLQPAHPARRGCCPACSPRATGSPSSGVTDPDPTGGPGRPSSAERRRPGPAPAAVHCSSTCPPCTSPTGTTCRARREDSRDSHAAALDYVDSQLARLFAAGRRAGAGRASRSSAPTTAPPTARTATPATASPTRWSGPSRTPSSSCNRDELVTGTMPRRLALPGLPLRLPAQDRLPAARPRPPLRDVWAAEPPRRAVPLPARAVLRDALRLLQPVHPGQRRRPSR